MGDVNKTMYEFGKNGSIIRELHAYGEERARRLGEDSVFDFSIGNPAVPAPKEVKASILKHIEDKDVHDYTSAAGLYCARKAIADNITSTFGAAQNPDHIYITSGAASAVAIALNALCDKGDEVILFAPYFPEYAVYATAAGLKVVVVGFDENFQIDFDDLKSKLTTKLKAVIINSPNNPTGVIYTKDALQALAKILDDQSAKNGKPIYIISDEPYRELVYGDVSPVYVPNVYQNAVVCYSFSKSLSLPGERMGYIAVNSVSPAADEIIAAIAGAGRALGYINANSLFQKVIADCVNIKPDLSFYKKNRDLLYNGLRDAGYECANSDGAFYLFVKTPNDPNFYGKAKELGLIVAPGDEFAAPGYFRLAYCTPTEKIVAALPLFKKLLDNCKTN